MRPEIQRNRLLADADFRRTVSSYDSCFISGSGESQTAFQPNLVFGKQPQRKPDDSKSERENHGYVPDERERRSRVLEKSRHEQPRQTGSSGANRP